MSQRQVEWRQVLQIRPQLRFDESVRLEMRKDGLDPDRFKASGGGRRSPERPIRDQLHATRGGTAADELKRWNDDLDLLYELAEEVDRRGVLAPSIRPDAVIELGMINHPSDRASTRAARERLAPLDPVFIEMLTVLARKRRTHPRISFARLFELSEPAASSSTIRKRRWTHAQRRRPSTG